MSKESDFWDRFWRKAYDAVVVCGQIEEMATQDAVGKPVEYQGSRIIRSDPGEPPRRETGQLQNSIGSTPYTMASGVGVAVHAGPAIGEDGIDYSLIERGLRTPNGSVLARPYLGPSMTRMEKKVAPHYIVGMLKKVT